MPQRSYQLNQDLLRLHLRDSGVHGWWFPSRIKWTLICESRVYLSILFKVFMGFKTYDEIFLQCTFTGNGCLVWSSMWISYRLVYRNRQFVIEYPSKAVWTIVSSLGFRHVFIHHLPSELVVVKFPGYWRERIVHICWSKTLLVMGLWMLVGMGGHFSVQLQDNVGFNLRHEAS